MQDHYEGTGTQKKGRGDGLDDLTTSATFKLGGIGKLEGKGKFAHQGTLKKDCIFSDLEL